jgi:pseudo-rSAM protein
MNKMVKYWFYIEPYTFFWEKQNELLFYNTLSKESFIFKKNIELMPISKSLTDRKNMNCIQITEEQLKSKEINKLIQTIRESFSGDLIPITDAVGMPISLPIYLNYQRDNVRLEKEVKGFLGDNILSLLFEIKIYIQQIEEISLPRSNVKNLKVINELNSFERIINLFRKLESGLKGEINFYSRNLIDPIIISIIKYFNTNKREFNFYVPLENIDIAQIFQNDIYSTKYFNLVFLVSRFNSNILNTRVKELNNVKKWIFYIYNETDYLKTETYIEKNYLLNYEIIPVFDGLNQDFFQKFIYITENDLKKPDLNKREIFAHQKINTNDFGKLTIMPDAKVYANPHFPALGTIDDDIRELIFRELTEGKSWLRIRDMKPCSDCVYQWLCPSPSNYELAIGKPNLCHIKP